MTNEITLEITDRRPFADGQAFGEAGAYERLTGRAHFAVDPAAPAQAGICDLDKAPVNADGLVEFSADIYLFRPADPARANRRVFYDWGNRANLRAIQFFNDAPASNAPLSAADAGNGFLFRRGYTVACCAWQGDILPGSGRLLLDLPVATDGGAPLTGPVRTEFIVTEPGTRTLPLSGRASTRSHPTVSMNTSQATLTWRRYAEDPRQPVAAEAWSFAREERGAGLDAQGMETGIIASDTHIHLHDGFEPGWIYELVYTGRDPLVLGLGHVAVRDFVSFLKHADTDANPLADIGIEKAYGWGRSQTGRAIRDFVYYGYNADAEGRRVFDGLLPHVSGGGLMWMNHRFANVISAAGQQYEDHDNYADRFPFAYSETTDHLTGKTDAILKRPDTDPLIIHSQTATEYWQRRGSLVHTDTQGNDLAVPDGVRIYIWGSSQHFANPLMGRPSRGVHVHDPNVVQTSMFFRAALDNLDAWASDGAAPPPSRHPTRGDGTLVAYEAWCAGFPAIPGAMIPQAPNNHRLLDFGPDAEAGILSKEPPDVVDQDGYPTLVPATDEDGIDRGCLLAPMAAAPLATYTGWAIRKRGVGHGAMFTFDGSTIPLPESPEEARATGDPRTSILERYGDADGYVAAIRTAAEGLVADGYMLAEDVERAVDLAADWGRPRHDIRTL